MLLMLRIIKNLKVSKKFLFFYSSLKSRESAMQNEYGDENHHGKMT